MHKKRGKDYRKNATKQNGNKKEPVQRLFGVIQG
jgi:hypothetical protein